MILIPPEPVLSPATILDRATVEKEDNITLPVVVIAPYEERLEPDNVNAAKEHWPLVEVYGAFVRVVSPFAKEILPVINARLSGKPLKEFTFPCVQVLAAPVVVSIRALIYVSTRLTLPTKFTVFELLKIIQCTREVLVVGFVDDSVLLNVMVLFVLEE